MTDKPSIFITGVTGYVGRRFLERIGSSGFKKIYGLARKSAPGGITSAEGVELVTGDLLEPKSYTRQLASSDIVVHTAAVTGKARPADYFLTNTHGTQLLIDECKQSTPKKLVSLSSIAVGFQDQERYFYAHSKAQAEHIISASGMPYTILRPTMIFGPGASVVEGLLKMARAPILPVFGDGRTAVQPIFVDDLVEAMATIVTGDRFHNETIEIGGPDIVTIEELLLRIRKYQDGNTPTVVHLPFGATRRVVSLLERFLLPIMPLTAGQLSSFINDGTARSSQFLEEQMPRMNGLDSMLRRIKSNG